MLGKSLQLCLTLCNPMDYCLSNYSVYGIFQARTLGRVAISCPQGNLPIEPVSLASAGGFFTTGYLGNPWLTDILMSKMNTV